MATDPVGYIFGGTSGVPTYEELKRRRAIAVALASQRRGFPKTVGEGMTYLGESIGDMLADRRLSAQERAAAAAGAGQLAALRGSSGYEPGTGAAGAVPAAPPGRPAPAARPALPPESMRPPPQAPRVVPPASAAAVPVQAGMPVLPSGPSSEAMTSGPPPSEFAMGGILNAAPLAEDAPSQSSILPSSGYLPPTATAAAPPSNAPAPATAPPVNAMDTAAEWPAGPVNAPPTSELQPTEVPRRVGEPTAPGPQSSASPAGAFSGDAPPNVLAQAQQVALQGGPAAVSRFMADAGYPKSGAWCGQFAAAVSSSVGVQPPAGPAVASNWRNVGTPVDTPQIGDIAIARPGWAPRRGSGATGQTGSHVTFVNQADPAGSFQGLGGNQSGGPVSSFNTRDFEFRRLPGDVQGHRIIGIPGEEPPEAQVASYAQPGVRSDAPPPGIGSAGGNIRMRSDPFQPPAGPAAPAETEQITPVDIEPMPATAQFGPPVGRFSRTDAPVPGVAAAAPPSPAPAALPRPPQEPAPTTYVGSTPSKEPIPPAQPQTMEPPGAAPVRNYPGGRPLSARQQRAMQIMQNPYSDPSSAGAAEQIFKVEEEYRKRAETQDESDYAAARTEHTRKGHEYEKFRREEYDRNIKQQGERAGLEKTFQEIDKARYEAGLPRLQEAEKNQIAIEQAKRNLAKPDEHVIGGVIYGRQPGQPYAAMPGSPSKEEKLTERQANTLKFFERATTAASQLGSTSVLAGFQDTSRGRVPIAGNYLVSEEYQRKRDAADAWMLSVLRDESGAVIGKEELPQHYPRYFPVPGDSEEVQANKAARRRQAQQSLYDSLGDARPVADRFLAERQGRKTTQPEGTTQINPKTGQKRRVIGGHWEILDADQ